MKFAINYSPEAAELVKEGVIDFDYFKCNEWPKILEPAQKLKPVYVHFPNNVGNNKEPDWQMIEDCLQISKSPLINTHLVGLQDDYPHIPIDSTAKIHCEELITNAIKDILEFTKRFGAENITVENLPHWTPKRPDEIAVLRCSVVPEVLNTVITETNTGLLFDIDHARTTCHYANWDVEDHTARLPMERLKELHMTGTRMHNGWLEAHLEMCKEDWPYFEWACKNIANGTWNTPLIFANEYGGISPHFDWRSDKECIAQQTPKFIEIMQKYGLR